MGDEIIKLSAKTWARTLNSIHKVRYSDGVVDGETKSFQPSFDMGFEEGLRYGLRLGHNNARKQLESPSINEYSPQGSDVNCLICTDNSKLKDNVMNLYNMQKERNEETLP